MRLPRVAAKSSVPNENVPGVSSAISIATEARTVRFSPSALPSSPVSRMRCQIRKRTSACQCHGGPSAGRKRKPQEHGSSRCPRSPSADLPGSVLRGEATDPEQVGGLHRKRVSRSPRASAITSCSSQATKRAPASCSASALTGQLVRALPGMNRPASSAPVSRSVGFALA